MEPRPIRVFVSGELVRAAEGLASRRGAAGRPTLHSTCLILAMIAVKEFCNVGYRETWKLFAERGFSKLPDFRTIHLRAAMLKHGNVSIKVAVKASAERCLIIIKRHSGKSFVVKRAIAPKKWGALMRGLKSDFVELEL